MTLVADHSLFAKWLVAFHLFPSQWLVVQMYMHYMIQLG